MIERINNWFSSVRSSSKKYIILNIVNKRVIESAGWPAASSRVIQEENKV